ncbi:MAG: ABC transporter substrate-binding protein [Acidimicrobiales bacterium]
MRNNRKSKLAAGLLGSVLLLAACGGGSDSASEDTSAGGDGAAGATAMTVTYDISDDAVWEDESPITIADFQCTYDAVMNTPGSISTSGYDKITTIEAGDSDKQVVVNFKELYAPWKGLFGGLIKKAAVADCKDISGDFQTSFNYSGTEWKMESWSADQVVYVPNEAYKGPRKAGYGKLVMVPRPETEITDLKAGSVDFIYPQFYAGITDELADPNVKTVLNYGGDYEALYMNLGVDGKNTTPDGEKTRAFADKAFREAFYKSVDLEALFKQIYIPIAADGSLLTCGPMVPGAYCPEGIFGNKYDQAEADKILTDAGYEKDGDGYWAKDGVTPKIEWVINTGNTRRESTQAYLIPLLQKAGFNVVAYNCDAECYFQKRLPGMDYDLAMYISTAPPDPSYLVGGFTSDNIPTPENNNVGQNFQGWANETATEALKASDKEVDEAKRAELIKSAIVEMDKDYIMIPLFQFPKSGAYRTDRVDNVEGELNNYAAFNDTYQWKDLDGDGQVVIGAEQWPGCLNPITECANSSWYVWTVANVLMPGAYRTTNDGKYVPTELLKGEAKVETK